ncbi:MAG: UDP-N-acetylmuramoyl-L-alanine--D-glutamate ligase [Epsilonproteobacteria bacterium]|nr:UDP-N-acetylmuramoyl-L-alanine--D-glutamate ligase [Campylobacterota bacterium]NPA63567.1 UDP-N-acetylmuramoyl-L-alanine--D-glutamate ligase [Campylobacterota bacterium]
MTLFGSGKTTKAIAKKFGNAIFFEDIDKEFVDEEGFLHRPSDSFDPARSCLEIPSPGIPPHHPLIQKAQNLISEYDLFASTMPYSIWISGTNGKTTTTQMIAHLLQDKGAIAGGNIGTPLAELDEKAPIWILESSSFTLHYTRTAKPNLYVLLPITPDHISWHGSFEAYEAAKLKPISRLQEGEVAIVPKKYAHIPSKGMVIGYESSEDLAGYFDLKKELVKFQGAFLLDALLALAVRKILFFDTPYERINDFFIDPHKQEEFTDALGRVWVDDSKATNIDATIEAIKRYQTRKIYLILGGDNKGVSLEPLFAHIRDAKVYAIGKAADEIEALCKQYDIPCVKSYQLKNAVEAIKKELTKNEVALLSPACASLDQFRSYKERGELFKQYILS